MADTGFTYSYEQLSELTSSVLDLARKAGASDAEADVSEGFGQTISVRLGEVETIEYNRDKGLNVTVYFGQRRGHASTSDLTLNALRETVAAACAIAKHTAVDDCAGLAEAGLLAHDWPDLDLYHPWRITVEEATELARQCERAALDIDPALSNSEGAGVSSVESQFVYGNTHGFLGGYPSSRHDLSCAVIAESPAGMQRDYWYDSSRNPDSLSDVHEIGRKAGQRTIRRLNARRLKTIRVPVLFEAPVACGLIGHLVGAASGSALYRRSSFLLDGLGDKIFPDWMVINEDPYLLQGQASAPFDNEGVKTIPRRFIDRGILAGYFLGSYSARKLGMQTTGNAGGNHNLIVESTGQSFDELVSQMGRGLLVTELLGHGINMVTGDYSRGAAGFWVENGKICYPVEEITIAGNLKEMFLHIGAVATDRHVGGSRQCGSILIDEMMVAGS
ncbi:MAG TPA: metalloprotease PmbA [Burkholderiales bacterium]|nr:metalloprotease PmbA [Burkholderiales bacterium]